MSKRHLTSREAYHRVVWDPRLDATAFVIGYTDRLTPGGVGEKPLSEWQDGGEIPWHRVVFLSCAGEVVWSRSPGEDRLSTGELPSAAWKPSGQ